VLPKELEVIAEQLARRPGPLLSLDEIADALGTLSVTAEEIDSLFVALESRGKQIGDPELGPASAALPRVLATARQMRVELGRAPNATEIAERSGLAVDAVRRALWFARILQR
jgi:hypothetical protein